ncbi:pentapeptide repeat-containing protein [Halotia branconii]|uniref:Uncharacterized protein n=1 Tax=Halotia branconii CENA392 TaxID=1539056 RepID=A0AAJ6NPA3_9CYAN|nr:pentapeptide repeat-containing protein [Halotia branconii]WGV24223.1 hypothetical protein QI031_20830 [Halotia branconii CENA392]
MSLNYRLFPERIRYLFGSAVQEEKDLDHWHYDMMTQTMLIRNADGDYTPAHRSLLEFFVAYKFAAELGVLASDFTELAKAQSCLDTSAAPVEYTWSGYFSRQLDDTGRSMAIAPLKKFISEPLDKLRETFGKTPLTKAVMELLLPILGQKETLINAVESTRGQSEDEVGWIGGNAATLAVKLDKRALEARDFNGVVINSADFTYASLRDINFEQANLKNSIFAETFGSILSIAFNSDSSLLATGHESDGIVHLWDVATGKEVLTLKGHHTAVW